MENQKLVLIGAAVVVVIIIVAILAGGSGNNILNTGPGLPQGYGPGQGAVQPQETVQGTGAGTVGNYPVLLPSGNTAPLSDREIADIRLGHNRYPRHVHMIPATNPGLMILTSGLMKSAHT